MGDYDITCYDRILEIDSGSVRHLRDINGIQTSYLLDRLMLMTGISLVWYCHGNGCDIDLYWIWCLSCLSLGCALFRTGLAHWLSPGIPSHESHAPCHSDRCPSRNGELTVAPIRGRTNTCESFSVSCGSNFIDLDSFPIESLIRIDPMKGVPRAERNLPFPACAFGSEVECRYYKSSVPVFIWFTGTTK